MDLDIAISLFNGAHLDYKSTKFQIQVASGYWEQRGNGFHGVRTKRSDFPVNYKWYYRGTIMKMRQNRVLTLCPISYIEKSI